MFTVLELQNMFDLTGNEKPMTLDKSLAKLLNLEKNHCHKCGCEMGHDDECFSCELEYAQRYNY